MNRHITRNRLLASTVIGGLAALAAAPALAQDGQTGATQVEEVVVTGSRIRRDPTTAPTPLIQVTQEQLLETGQATVIDYLATIPALMNSLVPSDTTGSGLNDGGLSFANLRSLGVGRTLVLVDGRRHVGSQAGTLSVDIDTIPRLLIENIEIVTGGASSVYGADAVSGVLNFKLRDDYEGVQLDANWATINEDGQQRYRVSALVGRNFLDDRLNLYGHAEYEHSDAVSGLDMDWLRRAPTLLGIDADPTSAANGPAVDGELDNFLFTGIRRLDRPRWGSTTLANAQRPSPLNDPDVPFANCATVNTAACYSVDPAKTFWYDGPTARLANFGQRIGNTGSNRPFNIGGDGENPSTFATDSRLPESTSQRYQVGGTFRLTDAVSAYAEAKYVTENTFDITQPTFFDIYLADEYLDPTEAGLVLSTGTALMRWSDNAFLPANVKAAIAANTVTNYSAPTLTTAGLPLAPVSRQWADHRMFGPDRSQDNDRDLQRYVFALRGDHGDLGFVRNIGWDLSYTYGQLDNVNAERGVDVMRFNYAADAVVDTAGVVNGRPGEIVCRVKLLYAQGLPVRDDNLGGDIRDNASSLAAVNSCVPLNIFGAGNQSQEGLDYVDAVIHVREQNRQHDAIASVSGQLWDFWGAGPMGVALGAEWRKEYTEGVGRSAETGDRFLFLNTGADFPGASYESREAFAELSLPLFRDSWLGEYAELSGSYRYADYTTVGETEVYGVNLVYRPIRDIAFKSSFNTSIRVPSLAENFSPFGQTFLNGFVDPCATNQINGGVLAADIRANRIANCTALAAAQGLSFDFAGSTATTDDDFVPVYASGIAGVLGGNPFLRPEESESTTFSVVLQPSFIPNFSLVLDYYEIEITNVIAAVGAQVVANNCVSGPSLNSTACSTIFRRNPALPGATTAQERSEAFKVGAPAGDPIGGFIQGSINYASREVRGLDFNARYSVDTADLIGRDWGSLDYSLNGSWLIQQTQFNNIDNPADATQQEGTQFFPRVRMTSTLSWSPTIDLRLTWTADWQTSQDLIPYRDFLANVDNRPIEYLRTGNFVRNDFAVRYTLNDHVTLRGIVTNAFDAEQAPWLGTALSANFDPYGRRYSVGLNYTF